MLRKDASSCKYFAAQQPLGLTIVLLQYAPEGFLVGSSYDNTWPVPDTPFLTHTARVRPSCALLFHAVSCCSAAPNTERRRRLVRQIQWEPPTRCLAIWPSPNYTWFLLTIAKVVLRRSGVRWPGKRKHPNGHVPSDTNPNKSNVHHVRLDEISSALFDMNTLSITMYFIPTKATTIHPWPHTRRRGAQTGAPLCGLVATPEYFVCI